MAIPCDERTTMKPIWKRVDKGVIDPVKDHSEETMVAGFRVRRIMRPTTAKSYSGFKPHHFHVLGKTGEMYRFDNRNFLIIQWLLPNIHQGIMYKLSHFTGEFSFMP